jgi:hypothetical protein
MALDRDARVAEIKRNMLSNTRAERRNKANQRPTPTQAYGGNAKKKVGMNLLVRTKVDRVRPAGELKARGG